VCVLPVRLVVHGVKLASWNRRHSESLGALISPEARAGGDAVVVRVAGVDVAPTRRAGAVAVVPLVEEVWFLHACATVGGDVVVESQLSRAAFTSRCRQDGMPLRELLLHMELLRRAAIELAQTTIGQHSARERKTAGRHATYALGAGADGRLVGADGRQGSGWTMECRAMLPRGSNVTLGHHGPSTELATYRSRPLQVHVYSSTRVLQYREKKTKGAIKGELKKINPWCDISAGGFGELNG
jgi:hypothetical protein